MHYRDQPWNDVRGIECCLIFHQAGYDFHSEVNNFILDIVISQVLFSYLVTKGFSSK